MVDIVERGEFLFPRAFNPGVENFGGRVHLRPFPPQSHGNRHGRLNRKHIVAPARAAPFAAEVENPNFVALPAHGLAHPAKRIPIEITRRSDKTDHPARRVVLKNLPQRPSPKINVEIVEILDVNPVPRGNRGIQKIPENRIRAIVAPANP